MGLQQTKKVLVSSNGVRLRCASLNGISELLTDTGHLYPYIYFIVLILYAACFNAKLQFALIKLSSI